MMTGGRGVGVELFEWLDVRGRAEMAQWAEERGFHGAYMAEVTDPDVFVTLGVVGAATKRIRLAPLVAQIGPRSVPMIASSASAVANVAPGRLVLGVGVSSAAIVDGWHGVPWSQPLVRARETVSVLRSILAGERTDVAGEQVRTKGFALAMPPDPPPPIFLAAANPKMLHVAGEVADGVMLTFLPVQRAHEVVDAVRAAATDAGRPKPEVVLSVMCEVTDEPDRAVARLREIMLFYVSVPAYRAYLSRLGFGEEMAAAEAAVGRRDKAAVRAAVTDELIDSISIIGSAHQVRERLEQYLDAGVDSPALAAMDRATAYDTLRAFAPVER
jgi:probable F420-dependent oxidoreductase